MSAPEFRRLLLIRLHRLGDVVLSTAAVRQLRRALPDARIDFLTEAVGAEALAGNPALDQVLVYERGLVAAWARTRALRARGYDAVIDWQSMPRSARAAVLSGAPRRAGYTGRGPRQHLYTDLWPKRTPAPVYHARRRLELLTALGIPTDPDDLGLELYPDAADVAWAAEERARLGLEGAGPVVALCGVSRDPQKRWPAARWAGLGDELARAGATVLLTHGPGEEPQAREIAGAMRERVVAGHGRPSVRRLAALYARCSLWIGNDGGLRHLAVAAGTPSLATVRPGEGGDWTDPRPEASHLYVEAPPGGPRERPMEALALGEVVGPALRLLHAHRDRVPAPR